MVAGRSEPDHAPLPVDPVLVRRARYASLARLGKAIGYALLLIAVIAFFAGFVSDFPPAAVTVSITGLIAACVFLPPAIIAGYAVKAAEREDRRAGRPQAGPKTTSGG